MLLLLERIFAAHVPTWQLLALKSCNTKHASAMHHLRVLQQLIIGPSNANEVISICPYLLELILDIGIGVV